MVLMAGWGDFRSAGDDHRFVQSSLRGQRSGLEGSEVEVKASRAVSRRRRPKIPRNILSVSWEDWAFLRRRDLLDCRLPVRRYWMAARERIGRKVLRKARNREIGRCRREMFHHE